MDYVIVDVSNFGLVESFGASSTHRNKEIVEV